MATYSQKMISEAPAHCISRLRLEKRKGFTLTEMLAVIAIAGVLLSFSLSGLSSVGGADPVTLASNQTAALIEQVSQDAKGSGEYRALVLSKDATDEKLYRLMTIARFLPTAGSDGINPLTDTLELTQRWLTLPQNTIVEAAFNDTDLPNLFYSDTTINRTKLCQIRSVKSGQKSLEVSYVIFDKNGSLVAEKTDDSSMIPFINNDTTQAQKGAYLFIREAKVINGRVTPELSEVKEFGFSNQEQSISNVNGKLIYISPLTSKVSQVPTQ